MKHVLIVTRLKVQHTAECNMKHVRRGDRRPVVCSAGCYTVCAVSGICVAVLAGGVFDWRERQAIVINGSGM